MFTKLVVLTASIFLALCSIGDFTADAGRTEYDLKRYKITTYGCDYELCGVSEGFVKVTVQNTHWNNYHGTPPALGENADELHDDDHDPAEQRNMIIENKEIVKGKKCDGTACGSDSDDDGDVEG